MDKLLERSNKNIHSVNYPVQRNVKGKINWEWRLNGIVGARGTGKTTLLLQRLKKLKQNGHEVLYVRLDDLYFSDHTIVDLADNFRKNGGEYLYMDEVHKYPDWSKELKNIYDSAPNLKMVFSGSSIIDLTKEEADLSRRALKYEMSGLSFREYLLMKGLFSFSKYDLKEILDNHVEIASAISKNIPVLKYFAEYLQKGFFPFSLEPERDYFTTLEQIIKTVVETDLQCIENFSLVQSKKMLSLLKIIAASAPFKPNISKISQKTNLHRQTVLLYLQYFEMAKMVNLVNFPDKYISRLQKPDKIFLENPNLLFVLNNERVNTGNLRETFAVNQLLVNHEVFLHKTADFMVDNHFIFEIGGKNKTKQQLQNLENAFILADGIEVGYQNTVPLWLVGFLY